MMTMMVVMIESSKGSKCLDSSSESLQLPQDRGSIHWPSKLGYKSAYTWFQASLHSQWWNSTCRSLSYKTSSSPSHLYEHIGPFALMPSKMARKEPRHFACDSVTLRGLRDPHRSAKKTVQGKTGWGITGIWTWILFGWKMSLIFPCLVIFHLPSHGRKLMLYNCPSYISPSFCSKTLGYF